MEEKLGDVNGATWDVPNRASHKPICPKELPLSPNSASLLGSLHERAGEPGKARLAVDRYSSSRCWMPRPLLTHAHLAPTSKFTSQTLGSSSVGPLRAPWLWSSI